MCGIVGYIGKENATKIVLDCLKRLEYRGYDSAGIGVLSLDGNLQIFKTKGQVDELYDIKRIKGKIAIGHTRWATHGEPSKENAHPHIDCKKNIAVVHNGIIENYFELKKRLLSNGHKFLSKTDSEVIPHILEEFIDEGIEKSVIKATKILKGTYAFAVIYANENKIIVARKENPVIIGNSKFGKFFCSDIPAILKYTNLVFSLENEEIGILDEDKMVVKSFGNKIKRKKWRRVNWDLATAEKGGYEHYMLKEIFEQPRAIVETMIGGYDKCRLIGKKLIEFDRIDITACGSSYHAGLIGKHVFENIAMIPTNVEISSEYRYMKQIGKSNTILIGISQSGETADTLAAIRNAKQHGIYLLGITNSIGSSMARESDVIFLTNAGPEICVVATKTFLTQLVALYLLAFSFRERKKLQPISGLSEQLRLFPRWVESILDKKETIKKISEKVANEKNVFYIGRGICYPVCMEGALKLKETAYIHSECFPAGELKHGALALITDGTLVIGTVTQDETYEKMLGNLMEVGARGAKTIAIGFRENEKEIRQYSDLFIPIPKTPPLFSPIPITVVFQLLAYYTARELACEIDKPRNLAKSVTVE